MARPTFLRLARTTVAAAAAMASLAGAARAETDTPDPYMLGRAQALMSQADQVLDGLGGVVTVEQAVSEAPVSDYARLYNATLDLERLRGRACDEGRLAGAWCAARWTAPWLKPPGAGQPTERQVLEWSAEFADPAIELSMAICALAAPDPNGGLTCSTE